MDKYNYKDSVKRDVKNWIEENVDFSTFKDKTELGNNLFETLWYEDSITGVPSGSYTCNEWKAEEYLCHNWNLLNEALDEYGYKDSNILIRGAEWCDMTIRCYILTEVINEILKDYF